MRARSFDRAVAAAAVALAAVPLHAAEEGGGGAALMTPKWGTVFWTTLTFLIVVFILGRWAWPPLVGALDERARGIRDSLEQARREREEAQRMLDEQRALMTEARRERAEAVAAGRREAEAVRARLLAEAEGQREQIVRQASSEIDAKLQQAKGELRALTADLAIRAAEKLLSKNLDDATQRRLVEEHLAEVERSAGGSRPRA
jgi:F-type H+-transporting ATPase subunit b